MVTLIRDEQAYRDALRGFLRGSLDAEEFCARFAHLWRCDASQRVTLATLRPISASESALYGGLDAIHSLCQDYARALPDGCGYRVSEEQFRLNVQMLAASHRLL